MKEIKVLSKRTISILDMVLFSVSIATALYLKDTYNISLWLYIIVAGGIVGIGSTVIRIFEKDSSKE